MTDVSRGVANTLSAEWRLYQGGPLSAVTGVTLTVTPLTGGAAVLGPVGTVNPATGINTYVWTPSNALPLGQYLAQWTGTDAEADTVTATEILTLTAASGLGGPYAAANVLKRRMGIPDADTRQDDDIASALLSASDAINRHCNRQFGRAAEASARTYYAGASGVDTDDFWTTDGLIIAGGAYDVATSTYALEPSGGIVDGVPGWPYNRLAYAIAWGSPFAYAGGAVTLTAYWGWAAVPAGVTESCLLLAADDLKSKDAPFGVAGFGDYVVRVRANPKVAEKLAPYVREPLKVA